MFGRRATMVPLGELRPTGSVIDMLLIMAELTIKSYCMPFRHTHLKPWHSWQVGLTYVH